MVCRIAVNEYFVVQEKNELERLYASLSFSLKSIIRGRYVFIFVNYVLAMIFSIIIEVFISALQNRNVDYRDIVLGIFISLLIFTIITGIQIPICFRLGYTKARAWCVIPFALVMTICILPSFIDVLSNIITELLKHQMILEIMCLIISFAILPVSYHLSVISYQKRR